MVVLDLNKIKIVLDKNACTGVGSCEALLSSVFTLDNDGRVKLVGGEALGDYQGITLEQLLAAAESCPTLAIKVIDTETGKSIFPK